MTCYTKNCVQNILGTCAQCTKNNDTVYRELWHTILRNVTAIVQRIDSLPKAINKHSTFRAKALHREGWRKARVNHTVIQYPQRLLFEDNYDSLY